MKVTKIDTFFVNAKLKNWLFVKIQTDKGVSGIGEATTEWCETAVEKMIGHLKHLLIGKDPCNVEAHVQKMYQDTYWRDGAVVISAISGIEQALWDVVGKNLRVPVYQLLGGRCREKIKIYLSLSAFTKGFASIEEMVDSAVKAVDKGYTAIKVDPFIISGTKNQKDLRTATECVRSIKEAVGEEVDIMIEGHGRLNPVTAIQVAKNLEPFRPYFFEEPMPPSHISTLSKIAEKTTIPIAIGERVFTKRRFAEILEKHAAQIIQPDPCHVGGILETKKIAAMAEPYQVLVAPHNPNGPVSTAVCAHISASLPNLSMLEGLWEWDVPWRNAVIKGAIEPDRGYIKVPEKSGLGIELDETAAEMHPYEEPKQFLW